MGKTGGGKSTIGCKLIDDSNILEGDLFEVIHGLASSKSETSACTTLLNNRYIVQVVDTIGFFDTGGRTHQTITKDLSAFIKERVPNGINLVLYVTPCGHWARDEQQTFDFIRTHFSDELSSISALVFTQCENYTDEMKASHTTEFIETHPVIAKFMQKGIHCVGFPDMTKLKPALRKVYEDNIKSDQEHLRQLVYSCNEMKQIKIGEETKCNIS